MHKLLSVAVVASCGAAASAQVFIDDQAGWEAAAVGPITAPDYVALGAALFDIGSTDYNGLFTVTVATNGASFNPDGDAEINAIGNFVFDFDPVTSVTITFNEAITGFAANWSNTFVQDGFSVSTNTATYDLNVLADPLSSTFIGVQEAAGFTSITLTTTDPNPGDDFVFFNSLQWSAVPSPGAAALAGLAGLAGLRRRR